MTTDPRARLAAAAADPAPGAAFDALRWALEWSVAALRELRTADDEATMAAVIALDDALTGSAGLVAEIPALADRGRTGQPVADHLRDLGDRLSAAADAVRATRLTLAELRTAERALHEQLAEHDELRRQVTELRRLARLATALEALSAQRALIDERVARLADQADGTEAGLAGAATRLRRLTDDQLGVLREPTRRALDEAAAAQTELAAEEQRATAARTALAEAAGRAEQLRAEREDRLTALTEHARADRAIADALGAGGASGLDRVRAALDQVRDRLHEVDTALGRALAESQTRHAAEHQPRNWAD